MVPKVSLQDFLPISGAPQPKITNRSFWPSCDQMVLLTAVRTKPGFSPFEMRPWVKFSKFWPGESISLRNFTPVVRKVSHQDFLPVLASQRLKITNRSFWPSCDQVILLTAVRPKPGSGPFEMRPWVKFSKFWPGETSDLYAIGPEGFPTWIFYPFWAPHRRKLRIGLFDRRVTKWYFWPDTFDCRATITLSRYFLTNGATNRGLSSFTSIL